MATVLSQVSGSQHHLRPKAGRIPLQPINSSCTPLGTENCIRGKQDEGIRSLLLGESNKENRPIYAENEAPTKIEMLDASLGEELSAIKKKLERLTLDREKTDKLLKERELVLELQRKDLHERGQFQKALEMEVDKLYRLKELRSYCTRVSPIRSLREKEQGNRVHGGQGNKETNKIDSAAAESGDESSTSNSLGLI